MKSLAERHADRAQRKADNAAESTAGDIRGVVGHAALAIATARDAVGALSDDEKRELAEVIGEDGFGDAGEEGDRAPLDMAGIGVVNPLTTSLSDQMRLADTAAQHGELPAPSFDPANGNLNGQAVEQAGSGAGNGWGAPARDEDADEDGLPKLKASMSVAEIEAIAAEEKVDLDGATNNDQRIAKIEEARAAKLQS